MKVVCLLNYPNTYRINIQLIVNPYLPLTIPVTPGFQIRALPNVEKTLQLATKWSADGI